MKKNKKSTKEQWKETLFQLSNGTEFWIIHNLPETQGLNIQGALDNWLVRTDKYTDKSFCDYINSKRHMTGHIAMTKKEYEELLKEV